MIRLISLVVSSVLIKGSLSGRILAVLPSPSISHQMVYRPLMHELARRGHEVVVITSDPAFVKGNAPANLTEIDVHDVTYNLLKDLAQKIRGSDKDLYHQMETILDMCIRVTFKLWYSTEVRSLVSGNSKFDLLFTETCIRHSLVFSHLFKAPVIQISSMGGHYHTFESMGANTHPILYPLTLNQKFVNLSIWDKLTEYRNLFHIYQLHKDSDKKFNYMLKQKLHPDFPTMEQLCNNIHMTFLNVHPLWDSNRPVPPSVIYLGGLHENPPQELSMEWKSYLDSSKNCVIYMSFGTNVQPSFLPPEKIQMFLNVFSTLPYNVLLKSDKEEMEGRPSNVKISTWFPQSDILRHPNVKLFINQGGLQSTDEAITAGVPVIGIPFLGDQWYNTELYVRYKIGLKLHFESLTEQVLKDAIDTVMNDGSYRANVIKLRAVMRDQPMTPLERAVWWTEHVLRHGGAGHLRAPSANMHWTQYYEIELVLTALISLLLPSVIILLILIVKLFINLPSNKLKAN